MILPGVGHFGHCLKQLEQAGFLRPILQHIEQGKPFLGICVGLQALFEGSAEDERVPGLSLIPGRLARFDDEDKSVPHIGWNSASTLATDGGQHGSFYGLHPDSKYYYVHSYAVPYQPGKLEEQGWVVATAKYGNETFIGAVGKGNMLATQFHPEKSGVAGLRVIRAFLNSTKHSQLPTTKSGLAASSGLTRRIIACLDVRSNDDGDLVVTKGDQYDV